MNLTSKVDQDQYHKDQGLYCLKFAFEKYKIDKIRRKSLKDPTVH